MAASGTALTRNDTAWLRMDSPHNPMVVTGTFRFGAPVRLDELRRALGGGLLAYDRFKQRVVDPGGVGLPRWIDHEGFDLDEHVIERQLPSPGDDDVLRAAIEDRLRAPLARDRPLWEMLLFSGHAQGCVLFFRVHHCIADGIALMQVLIGMCDALEGAARDAPMARPERRWWFWPALPLTGTWWMLKCLVFSVYLVCRPKDAMTLYKGELSGIKRVAWTQTLPLDRVKATARAAGVKINDLLMCAATGALRRYAEAAGAPLGPRTLRAMIPVNLRSAAAAEQLGNKFALLTPTLPVDMGDEDTGRRLAVTKRRMDRLKRSPEPFATVVLLNLLGLLGTRLQHRVQHFLADKASLAMSNVPGPRKKLSLAGQTIEQILFWVPTCDPTALGLSIFSYADEITVGVVADAARVPDPQRLADAFGEELQALQARYCGSGANR